MDKPVPNLFFRGMSVLLSIRYRINPPKERLEFLGLKPGMHLLDFGCGPGGFTIAAAEMVGENGKVYSLDIQPLAGPRVKRLAAKKGLNNIETICSDCDTGLPDSSLDIVILYDILHMLSEPGPIFAELHRILKPSGILSVDDHHMKEGAIIPQVTEAGLFEFKDGDERMYNFAKVSSA